MSAIASCCATRSETPTKTGLCRILSQASCIHTCIYLSVYLYIYIYIHAYIHTHTYILEIPRTGFSRTGFMDVYPKSSALFLAIIQNHSIKQQQTNT